MNTLLLLNSCPMDSKEYHMGHHDSPGFVETLLYFSGCRVIIMLCIAMYPWESVSKVKSMMFLTSILHCQKGLILFYSTYPPELFSLPPGMFIVFVWELVHFGSNGVKRFSYAISKNSKLFWKNCLITHDKSHRNIQCHVSL